MLRELGVLSVKIMARRVGGDISMEQGGDVSIYPLLTISLYSIFYYIYIYNFGLIEKEKRKKRKESAGSVGSVGSVGKIQNSQK